MMKHAYYYSLVEKILKFLVPEKATILYYGLYNESILDALNPDYSVSISEEGDLSLYDDKRSTENKIYRDNWRGAELRFEEYIPEKKFDYIILDNALGKTNDICILLKNVFRACDAHTRLIIHQENHLWESFLKLAGKIGLKREEKTKNWLSVSDIHTYLKSSGFEPTRTLNKNIFPVKLVFAGPVLNWLCCVIPFFDFFKLNQFIIARAILPKDTEANPSVTICLTVRDEEKNIESLVKSLPVLCDNQEILFVEGHSADNTVREIQRMQLSFPEKNIRLLRQNGAGQGDAIRLGFNSAHGELIILYEGDGTSEPDDLQHVYECMANRRFEFIEGSRFSYPLAADSMPLLNKIGNIFFAKWFSLFLRQRVTDVLSGIKAISKKDFERINRTWGKLGVQDPFGDFELLYGSVRHGLKIGEIPIHYKPRVNGNSKTHPFMHGTYLFRMALSGYWIFRNSKL